MSDHWLRIRNFRVKISEFYEIFKIRKIRFLKNSFYRITSKCKVFEFAQHTSGQYWGNRWMETVAVMIEDCDSDTGEDSEAAGDS